jgi:hypothetical protein
MLFCVAVGAGAQAPHAPALPTPAEQQAKLAQLRANLAEYRQHPLDLTCIQPTLNVNGSEALLDSPHFAGAVTIDLGPRKNQPGGFAANFEIEPILDDLLAPDAQFTYGRATVRRKRVEVYRYSEQSESGLRHASVYTDPDSGVIFRIVLYGFNTPASAQLFCQAQPK